MHGLFCKTIFTQVSQQPIEEKLILALGLGSTGQHINPTGCSRPSPIDIRLRRSLNYINETSSGDWWIDIITDSIDLTLSACRRKRSTCEKRQVCSGFGMTSYNTLSCNSQASIFYHFPFASQIFLNIFTDGHGAPYRRSTEQTFTGTDFPITASFKSYGLPREPSGGPELVLLTPQLYKVIQKPNGALNAIWNTS